jgi:hypothetical protein
MFVNANMEIIWRAKGMANCMKSLYINTETVESGSQGQDLGPKRLKHEAGLMTIKLRHSASPGAVLPDRGTHRGPITGRQ